MGSEEAVMHFTPYAEDRVQRRKLSRELVVVYLLRVIYEQIGEDKLVITAYQTSKIRKYWRPE